MSTKNTPAADLEGPLGTKRHVGRTGPRVDPIAPLSTLIRFCRESVPMSRPELSRYLAGAISVASIHTLEHERAPRDGELDILLPALKDLVGDAKWVEFGGEAFIAVKPAKTPRKRASRVVAKSTESVETPATDSTPEATEAA